MRRMKLLKLLLAHVCVICSLSYGAVQVLDWYNPFMDFAGHAAFVRYLLCLCAFLLGIMEVFQNKRDGGRQRKRGRERKENGRPMEKTYA